MSRVELVPGPSAGTLDIWRQLLNLASIVVPVIVGAIMFAVGVRGIPLAVVVMVLLAAVFVVSLAVGARGTRVMRREMEAGYSTVLDVEGFELRDARTLDLLRPSTTKPTGAAHRSLVASLFRVKPGTIVARRLEDDERESRD